MQRVFTVASFVTAVIFGFTAFAAIPAFAQTDDYGTGTTAGTYCPQLFQTVVRGSSGNQVLELQKFLSDYYDISPATIQTGYFGRITQGYVIQFQKEQGLPSYGIAGSMTRVAIARVCKGSVEPTVPVKPVSTCDGSYAPVCGQPVVNCPANAKCDFREKTFSNLCQLKTANATYLHDGVCAGDIPRVNIFDASPSWGNAPLTVKFTIDTGSKNYFGGYEVDFGDSATCSLAKFAVNNKCADPLVHTYTSPGEYRPVLRGIGEGQNVDEAWALIRVESASTAVPIPNCTMNSFEVFGQCADGKFSSAKFRCGLGQEIKSSGVDGAFCQTFEAHQKNAYHACEVVAVNSPNLCSGTKY